MRFEIGEIAVGQHFVNSKYLNGSELEVVSGLESHLIRRLNDAPCDPHTIIGYGIRHPAGHITYIEPYYLRKKKPPEEEINWVEKLGLVKWNPTKQGVEA